MAESTVWWLLAGGAVALELATGTFYLLMLAVGFGAAALAAHFGLGVQVQLVVAAAVGGGAVLGWHLFRGRGVAPAPARANPDVNPDVGETVQVDSWREDGTATARYRGASWAVVAAPGTECVPGAYRVREVVGNRLVVERT